MKGGEPPGSPRLRYDVPQGQNEPFILSVRTLEAVTPGMQGCDIKHSIIRVQNIPLRWNRHGSRTDVAAGEEEIFLHEDVS